jgi:hypothetical protein
MYERSRNSWNPLDPNNQGTCVVLNKILSNTVEQFLQFFISSLVLSIYLNPSQMRIIPIMVVEWTLARLLFEFG